MSGQGYKGLANLANSMSLLRGEDVAWDALFAAEGKNNYLEELRQNSQAPVNYGIVCIDIDAKRIDSHQGYGAIGRPDMDSRLNLMICLDKGILPHPLEEAGILLDAYMGGALVITDGAEEMLCAQTDPREAGRELISRLHDFGDFQLFTELAIKPAGWKVVRWGGLKEGEGLF